MLVGLLRDEIAEISDKLTAPDSNVYRRTEHGHHQRVNEPPYCGVSSTRHTDSSTPSIADSPKRSMLHTLIGQPGEECLLPLGCGRQP